MTGREDADDPSPGLKAIYFYFIGLLACFNCYTILYLKMGVIWLLSVAIICHSTHLSTAWHETHTSGKTNQQEAQTSNRTFSTENRIYNSTFTNHNETNSTNENAIREKRGTLLQDNELEKRGQKLKFSSWAGKRSDDLEEDKRAKFSSWGGKRFDEDYVNGIYDRIKDLKRAKFSSWGGKRDYLYDDTDKRAKFSSWAGKRSNEDIMEDKRTKFNSWAGKRTPDSMDDKRAKFASWAGKRGKFNSWAGKRSDPEISSEESPDTFTWNDKSQLQPNYFAEDKRAKFSSWAGKRSPDYVGNSWNKMTPDNRMKYYSNGVGETDSENIMKLWQDLMSRKRARFSSWAGKRSDETASDVENLERLLTDGEEKWSGEEKRKFSSWGGKRDGNGSSPNIVKRSVWSSPSIAYKRKPIFSSWGGKRSTDPHTIQARSVQRSLVFKTRPWGTLMRPIRKQPEFYAWGGKRST